MVPIQEQVPGSQTQGYDVRAVPGLAKNPLNFFMESLLERGDLVPLNLGPMRLLLVHHPDYVRYVLQDNWRNYSKGSMWAAIRKLVGNGLLASEGNYWLRQRRLLQPAFHRQKLAELTQTITVTVAEMVYSWQAAVDARQPIEMSHAMSDLTMQIIVRTMFGGDISKDEARGLGEAFTKALQLMNTRMWTFFLPDFLPLPGDGTMRESLQQIDAVVYRFIEQRRQNPGGNDLISVLLEMQDAETGERMTDPQVRDEVFTMFLAGHETSATVLSWVWWLLWQHPEVERRLQQEVDQSLGGRMPTFADLPKLIYTRQVIDETLRMYPPAWLIPRTAVADDKIGNQAVKAGMTILMSPYVVHRHPTFWTDADRFDPERFASSEVAQRHAYIPFGEGPRLCMGNNFAIMEMQLIVAMVVQAYRLSLKPGIVIQPTTMPVLRPNQAVWMYAYPRPQQVKGRTWLIQSEGPLEPEAAAEPAAVGVEES
jgi:cytochrome P450